MIILLGTRDVFAAGCGRREVELVLKPLRKPRIGVWIARLGHESPEPILQPAGKRRELCLIGRVGADTVPGVVCRVFQVFQERIAIHGAPGDGAHLLPDIDVRAHCRVGLHCRVGNRDWVMRAIGRAIITTEIAGIEIPLEQF